VNANGSVGGIHQDVSLLLGQLSPKAEPLKISRFLQICLQHSVFVARDDERLNVPAIGTATLAVTGLMTGTLSRISDVVVDQEYRRRGVATMLMKCAHERARVLNLDHLTLSCNPWREGAHELYLKLGYKRSEADIYAIDLSKS
jgi:GNAT superfamily N-acetyltransferase